MINQLKTGEMQKLAAQPIRKEIDYEVTDKPEGGITNAQMQAALTTTEGFYQVGSVYTCTDDGEYTKKHLYKFNGADAALPWEDVTPQSEIEVDQEYDPTSTNAQSGRAVAQAIATVVDIGAGQATIDGTVYPTISKDDADEIYLKYANGRPITLLWGTTGIATHISVIYASDIDGYELHCSIHGKVAVYKWTNSTTGTIAPTISSKWMHTITIDHTTAVGSWHYQFSFVNDTPTPYTQLGQVGHYLFDNKLGIRIPATGLYTANTDKYLIAAVKSETDNMVTVEMYKVADGTLNSISTGVIDVTDYVQ